MYKQSANYGRLVIKSLLVLSLLRNWNKWWLVFQLAHRRLFNIQCTISSIIVPHCFQGKCVLTFQLDFEIRSRFPFKRSSRLRESPFPP